MRLGWNTVEKSYGVKLRLSDCVVTIVDKDDSLHSFVVEGSWHLGYMDRPRPYAHKSKELARDIIESREYLKTDKGLHIPRCNIKHVTFSEVNEREVEPTYVSKGIKDWDRLDWFAALFCTGVGGGVLFVLGLVVYAVIRKHG